MIPTDTKIIDVLDEQKCGTCKGRCCMIYKSALDGGTRSPQVWFEEWCEAWDEEFSNSGATGSGIQPLFDPLVVHLTGNEKMIEDLNLMGINPDYCKYRGQSGCMLSRQVRPKACREYMCQEPEDSNEPVKQ